MFSFSCSEYREQLFMKTTNLVISIENICTQKRLMKSYCKNSRQISLCWDRFWVIFFHYVSENWQPSVARLHILILKQFNKHAILNVFQKSFIVVKNETIKILLERAYDWSSLKTAIMWERRLHFSAETVRMIFSPSSSACLQQIFYFYACCAKKLSVNNWENSFLGMVIISQNSSEFDSD